MLKLGDYRMMLPPPSPLDYRILMCLPAIARYTILAIAGDTKRKKLLNSIHILSLYFSYILYAKYLFVLKYLSLVKQHEILCFLPGFSSNLIKQPKSLSKSCVAFPHMDITLLKNSGVLFSKPVFNVKQLS